jgi:L-2,4-diaminobutyric acid acetyltransferase
MAVNELISRCPPLDTNSVYCNLLQCHHFADTCVLAELDGEPVGFVSAYCPPSQPDVLFIWQLAVSDKARGQGLARGMLETLLLRPELTSVAYIHTTINPDNKASWAVFESIAERLETTTEKELLFSRQEHFKGQHDDEVLLKVGPFAIQASSLNQSPPVKPSDDEDIS